MGKNIDTKQIPTITPDYLFLIKELMLEHGITENETLYLFAKLHKIEWSIDASSYLRLLNKNLIDSDKNVKQEILFRRYSIEQLEIELTFETTDKTTNTTAKLVENLWNKFVDTSLYTKAKIATTASSYFSGDTTIAKYFVIFMNIFPQGSSKRNAKWNKAFGVVFDGVNRQEWSVRIAKKFRTVYSKKEIDPGILLSAAYFFVKDGIDDSGEAFISKPISFLNTYHYWYEFAEEDFNSHITKKPDVTLEI